MEPRNQFQGMNYAGLWSLAGRYDNPIPPRFLAPIDSLKVRALYNNPIPARFLAPYEIVLKLLKRLQIRAQATLDSGIGSLESIPGLLKCLQIQAQATLASGIASLKSIPGLLKRCLHWIAELFPWNRFLGSLNVYKYGLRLHWLAELVPWNRFLGFLYV